MSMQQVPPHRRVVVGVDTHKHIHVAVAIDELGAVLDRRSFAADSGGYGQLIDGPSRSVGNSPSVSKAQARMVRAWPERYGVAGSARLR